jgi:prevent-host-death family protein
MMIANIHEAKSNLSRLIDAVESGREPEIILARNGRPSVRIVPLESGHPQSRRLVRLGVAKGLFKVPETIDGDNEAIERLFYGEID